MNSNEFWCRAFLVELGADRFDTDGGWSYEELANHCEGTADAALAVAQRRGMVTGGREAPGPAAVPEPDVLGWLAAQESHQKSGPRFGIWRPSHGAYQERRFYARRVEWTSVGLCLVGNEDGRELAFAAFHIMRDWTRVDAPAEAPGPKVEVPWPGLERPGPLPVEFTAERYGALWTLRAWELGALGIQVLSGRETYPMGSGVVRIKWDASTTPPSPVEVTVERAPKLERVEFTARCVGNVCEVHVPSIETSFRVLLGCESMDREDGSTVHFKWGETMPLKPIEVWIERAVSAPPAL